MKAPLVSTVASLVSTQGIKRDTIALIVSKDEYTKETGLPLVSTELKDTQGDLSSPFSTQKYPNDRRFHVVIPKGHEDIHRILELL
jgi:hypothetical protein